MFASLVVTGYLGNGTWPQNVVYLQSVENFAWENGVPTFDESTAGGVEAWSTK